jgi:hypothetical protein
MNCNHPLDLRLRNATAQSHGRGHQGFGSLGSGRTALEGMGATRPDLSASDSGPSTFGSRAGRAGLAIAHLWPAASSDDAAGHKGDPSFRPLQAEKGGQRPRGDGDGANANRGAASEGLTYQAIANELGLSYATVRQEFG